MIVNMVAWALGVGVVLVRFIGLMRLVMEIYDEWLG